MKTTNSQPQCTPINAELIARMIQLANKHYGSDVAALIQLLSTYPLRLSEILPLRYEDLEKKEHYYSLKIPYVKSLSEPSQIKNVAISEEAYCLLAGLKQKSPGNKYFFESKRSTNRTNKEPTPFTRQFLSQVLKNIGEMTKHPITFSELRREMLTKYLNKYIDKQ